MLKKVLFLLFLLLFVAVPLIYAQEGDVEETVFESPPPSEEPVPEEPVPEEPIPDPGPTRPLAEILEELVQKGGGLIISLIIAAMASVGSSLTGWIKGLNLFTEGEKSKIAGLGAELVNGVSSLLVTLVTIGIGHLVGLIGDIDFVQLLAALAGATWGGSSLIVHKLNKALR